MNIIETTQLTHRYGGTDAVHDLTLAVPEGTVFALLGPNGAGKTTTIKILMNLIRPQGGSARVLGAESTRLSPRELARIGYVSENQQLPKWMTVRQFMDYCRAFYPEWDRDLEARLLRELELPQGRRLRDLSRGMLMKAVLVSSIAYRPRLLVLDEPFSGLDPLVREEVAHGLLEVAGIGDWSVFISSHDIEEVERLADTIGYLDAGRLRFTESTESLLGRFRRIELTLEPGAAPPAQPPGCLEWSQKGSRLSYVETAFAEGKGAVPGSQAHPMTLREVFIVFARAARAKNSEGRA